MELRSLIWKLLKEQLDQNTINLKNKYVGEGKPISENDFNKIVEVTGNKFYLLSWLTKKVGTGIIKSEDIYKYKKYFDIFEKNKRKFEHNDIHLYKTAEDVKNFLRQVIDIREGDIVYDEIHGKDNFITQNEIEKLENSGGVKYLGLYDDKKFKYQVFQIFGVNQKVWKLYRDILGRCKGREKGASIDICTIANYSYFKRYLTDPKGSSYFLLYNLDDPKSPYQLHYESGQFVNKRDDEVNNNLNQYKFFEFIGNKVPQYSTEREDIPSEFEMPVKGKGTLNEKGKKEGLWRQNYSNGNIQSLTTYKNGIQRGPFVTYWSTGKVSLKGTHDKMGELNGKFERYYSNGKLEEKGEWIGQQKVGIWTYVKWDGTYKVVDYESNPASMSGFSKNHVLKYIADIRSEGLTPYGKVVKFYRSGKIQGMGKIGKGGPLDEWEWFLPNGKIKSKGKYSRSKREGEWTDLVENTKGELFYFVASFWRGIVVEGKVDVYNLKGEFLKTIKEKNIRPWPYWESFDRFWNE